MQRSIIEEWLGFGISRRFILFILALVFAACSGGSCGSGCSDCGGCGGFEERPYPPEFYPQTVQQSGQIRVTPTGLDFVEANIPTLLESALPGGLNFCLPAQTSSPEVCNTGSMCTMGGPGCDISLTLDNAQITPMPPDTLSVDITIGGLDETIPITIDVFGADVDCDVEPHLRGDENQPARVSATVPITFSVESASPTGDVRIEVGELDPDLSELDFKLSGGFACSLGNLATRLNFVRNLIIGQITGPLQDAVDGITRENLCRQCDPMGGCPSGSSCTTADNVCDFGNGDCVPAPLGMEGRFLLGDALADFTENPDAAMDLLLKVADHAEVNDGLTLGLRSGYQPDELRRCIPVDPTARPNYDTIPLSQTIVGNTKPNGMPFMFGFGYHKKAIQHALWSVWGSGATCLMLDSDFASQLSAGVFVQLLSSLRGIVGRDATAALKIVPQEPPDVILGSNEVMESGDSYEIVDPLMTIDWKDLDLHIYVWAQERQVRIARLRVDVIVPIAIVPDGMGQIVPVIGDLSNAVQNVRPFDTEIASEDPQVIADLVPTLVAAALPSLAGDLVSPIELPELFGLQVAITPEDITSVDNETMIAIFANLEAAGMPLVEAPNFGIRSATVDYSNVLESGVVRPRVELEMLRVDGLVPEPQTSQPTDGLEVEYAYRVDDGFWSLYHRKSELVIDHPILGAPGKHRIEVRARYRGLEQTATAPVSTEIWIDWDDPVIEDIDREGERFVVEAYDLAEPAEGLEYRFRILAENGEAEWTAWSNEPWFEIPRTDARRARLDVEVRDRLGNTGSKTQMVKLSGLQESAPVSSSSRSSSAGCSSAAGSTSGLALLVFFALLLGLRRTRRSRFAQIAVLSSILAFSGCSCEDEDTASNECPQECGSGTYCNGEECVTGCGSDDDCIEGERCEENQCVTDCEATCDQSCGAAEFGVCDEAGACTCEAYCGGGCEEGSFCCQTDNACQALPDPCVDQVCDPGFEPAVMTAASGSEATCEVTDGTCECVSLPPLELGLVGPYLDLDSNAGITAVTAYNATYEDFMLGIYDGSEFTWTFVDGVPADGMIGGALDGPRGGIESDGPEVGTHTALVIDDSGTLHMFYRDIENSTMKYVRGTGAPANLEFEIQEIDATPGTGFWTDAILYDGAIHVVWLVDNFDDGGNWVSQVRTATFDPAATAELTPETLFSGASSHPCGDSCAAAEACVQATGECVTATNDCANACGDGQVCFMANCEIEYVAGRTSRLTTTGQHLELSQTPDGLLLTFYDHEQRSAGWTRYTDSWAMPQFVGTPSGPYVSGFVDASDKLHLAYMDTQAKSLVYQNVTDGVTETVVEGARDTADMWIVTDIGEDVTMRVDADGSVVLVYHDATLHTLHLAERATDGTWTVSELAGRDPYMGSHGFYATLQKVADTSLIAHWSINQQVDPRVAVPVVLQP